MSKIVERQNRTTIRLQNRRRLWTWSWPMEVSSLVDETKKEGRMKPRPIPIRLVTLIIEVAIIRFSGLNHILAILAGEFMIKG